MRRAWVVTAAFVVLASISALAQIHGVPASVTSMGGARGGSFSNPPGVPASVTSLGPRGFQDLPCCTVPGFRFRFGGSNFVRSDGRRFDNHHHFRGFPYYGYPIYGPYIGYVPLYDSYDVDSPSYVDPRAEMEQYEPAARAQVTIHDDPAPAVQPSEEASLKPPAAAAPAPTEEEPTALVFRDGRRMEVHNYAIVGQTLFNFDGHGARKIPLADLDLEATRKLNDDRGTEFHVPGQ